MGVKTAQLANEVVGTSGFAYYADICNYPLAFHSFGWVSFHHTISVSSKGEEDKTLKYQVMN